MNSSRGTRERLVNLVAYAGGVALVGLLVLIVGNVLFRLTGRIIPGSYELAELIIPIIAGTAVLCATLSGSHVAIDFVVDRFPHASRRRIAIAMALAGALYWCVVAWAGALVALRNTRLGEYTEVLGISVAPLRWMWVAVCCGVAAWLAAWKLHAPGDEPNESD